MSKNDIELKFEERENLRKKSGVVKSMLETPIEDKPKKGRPVDEEREKKARITYAILPSVHEKISKIAYVERRSISELVSSLIEGYVDKNTDKLEEYEKIKK
jgi:hypothetical protein